MLSFLKNTGSTGSTGLYQYARTEIRMLSSFKFQFGYFLILISIVFNGLVSESDGVLPGQLGFQMPATPTMHGILNLHDDIMFFMSIICIFVLYLLIRVVLLFNVEKNNYSKIVHGKVIEIVGTIAPSLILACIAVPSFALLYSMDEVLEPVLTLKIVGHQGYGSYEYSDCPTGESEISFDSYMIPEEDLEKGQLRLLEVDNPIYLPVGTHIRLLITSDDVLHCGTIPSFGCKVDACPGRLNQTSLFIERQGTYYGQCSEICGVNHGFMPIAVQAVSLDTYIKGISSQSDSNR